MMLTPLLLVCMVGVGYYMLKKDLLPLPGVDVLMTAPPQPGMDGTVRFVPPAVVSHASSTETAEANVTADIVISANAILVNGDKVVTLIDNELKPEDVDAEGLVGPLFAKLKAMARPPTPSPATWRTAAHVSAERTSTYRVLKAVGDTANQAGFFDLSFETLDKPDEAP